MTTRIFKILTTFLTIAIVIVSIFFAYPKLTTKSEVVPIGVKYILRIWNVDTFEGGKGSRTEFLNSVAKRYENTNKECLVTVISHTLTSAKTAAENGEFPDMFSFGSGGALFSESFIPLEKYDFKTSLKSGKTFAVPWCRGEYFIFTIDGDFSDVNSKNTIISKGAFSLSQVAAAVERLNVQTSSDSVSAYVDLIKEKFKYLIGTQRDVARLNVRGIAYRVKPLENFCDLYQYISIITSNTLKYSACLDFLSLLLSENIQKNLTKIGMMSEYYNIYDSSNGALQKAEKIKAKYSVSAFIDENGYKQMNALAENVLKGDCDNLKKLKNFLI